MIYDTQILHQCISMSNVEIINSYILEHLKNPDAVNKQKWSTYYSVGQRAENLLNSILPKLENESLRIHYYVSHGFAGPHSDKGWIKGGRTYIIPLENATSYTVVFNQIDNNPDFNNNFFANAPTLNEEIKEEYKHIDLSHLGDPEKLSIECAFFWVAGDALIFDRKKLHCSDNFINKNIGPKKAIVIWSEIA